MRAHLRPWGYVPPELAGFAFADQLLGRWNLCVGTVLGIDLTAGLDRVRIFDRLREETHTDTFAGSVTVANTARHITLKKSQARKRETYAAKRGKQIQRIMKEAVRVCAGQVKGK